MREAADGREEDADVTVGAGTASPEPERAAIAEGGPQGASMPPDPTKGNAADATGCEPAR